MGRKWLTSFSIVLLMVLLSSSLGARGENHPVYGDALLHEDLEVDTSLKYRITVSEEMKSQRLKNGKLAMSSYFYQVETGDEITVTLKERVERDNIYSIQTDEVTGELIRVGTSGDIWELTEPDGEKRQYANTGAITVTNTTLRVVPALPTKLVVHNYTVETESGNKTFQQQEFTGATALKLLSSTMQIDGDVISNSRPTYLNIADYSIYANNTYDTEKGILKESVMYLIEYSSKEKPEGTITLSLLGDDTENSDPGSDSGSSDVSLSYNFVPLTSGITIMIWSRYKSRRTT